MLATEVRRHLQAATSVSRAPPPKMLVVPHAGYRYSGAVAARAYALLGPLRSKLRRVVLLGPVHRVPVRGLALPSSAAFATPLGAVPIDQQALAQIADLPQVTRSDAAHAPEHSIEVQLPFLQTQLADFELLPLAVGDASAADVAQVLERLWGGDETLIVISTDLSHYLRYEQAREVDRDTVNRILRGDPVLDHRQACGAMPLSGALLVAKAHGLQAQLLDLRNSGDTSGDRSRVVGYCAIAFAPPVAPGAAAAAGGAQVGAGRAAEVRIGAVLLGAARAAIAEALGLPASSDAPSTTMLSTAGDLALEATDDLALAAAGASFVTLHRQGRLRGCIGTLQPTRALLDDVRAHAVAAALRDPRFAPLSAAEFADLAIEVSVLGPMEPLPVRNEAEALQHLRPGADGLLLEWQQRRATFLPQVWAQLPTPQAFMAALKQKAGLAPDFWADNLRLSRYTVRSYSHDEAVP